MARSRRTIRYRSNGSAAYDVYEQYSPESGYVEGNAVRAPERVPLPEERPLQQPVRKRRPRAKPGKLLVSALCAAVAVLMLTMVISGYVHLYEATSTVSELKDQLTELESEQATLQNRYEGLIDLGHIETVATEELGMVQPSVDQTVYLDLSGPDKAEIIQQEKKSGAIRNVFSAIWKSAAGLVEYFV